ncbi:BatD family protein [Salipiger thiooxidans]|uniref:BatD family protein n=1 Tax=Salipiger thiooxidans TaxID=282683 RepID=UPI001CD5DE53|nr:BatD family protein [Salipiger thiooxidans]MCA0850547.1 BatD family protein [Salipiger thiooxidans]
MIRAVLVVLAQLLPLRLAAQEDALAPQLLVEFPETEAIPGQFLSLRLTVLVPTFMPKPPQWPGFEAPNLIVRLPEGSSNPISKRVNGETWSGVTRRYRIAPMVPGDFILPPQQVRITYRNPAGLDDLTATLKTDAIGFSGILPEGAEGLDPFLAASDLVLTQELEGTPGAMVPGDSLSLRLVAEVEGVSPMFLPQMLPRVALEGLAAYPDEPQLAETDDRGVLSGTRTESVTYVAEAGGGGTVPAVELQWYDIDDGTVKTASVAPVTLQVDGPPAQSAAPLDLRRLLLLGLAVVVGLAGVIALVRRALPVLARRREEQRARVLASENHAWQQLSQAVARRDDAALRPALDLWASRCDGADPRRAPAVQHALLALGAARYGGGEANAPAAWHMLDAALRETRGRQRRHRDASPLPPLNPGRAG